MAVIIVFFRMVVAPAAWILAVVFYQRPILGFINNYDWLRFILIIVFTIIIPLIVWDFRIVWKQSWGRSGYGKPPAGVYLLIDIFYTITFLSLGFSWIADFTNTVVSWIWIIAVILIPLVYEFWVNTHKE